MGDESKEGVPPERENARRIFPKVGRRIPLYIKTLAMIRNALTMDRVVHEFELGARAKSPRVPMRLEVTSSE